MKDIRTRLSLVFATLGLLCIAIAAVALHGLTDASERAERTYQELTLPAQYLADEYRFLVLVVLQVYEANQINNPSASKPQFDLIDQLVPALKKRNEQFKRSKKPESAQQLAQEFSRNIDGAVQGLLESAELARKGDVAASMDAMNKKSRPFGIAAGQNMSQLTELLNKEAEAAQAQAADAHRRMQVLLLGALVAGGVLCGLAVWRQMRAIGNSLGGIQRTLHEVNHSLDLTQRAKVQQQDEIGRTALAFNALIEKVEATVLGVRGVTDSVHTAAREIASGNADLSARTEEQATALEQTASRMRELTEAVTKNADGAQTANTLANQAANLADEGDAAAYSLEEQADRLKSVVAAFKVAAGKPAPLPYKALLPAREAMD